MADTITLTCSWGRAPLPASAGSQLAYLLVEAEAGTPTEALPLNFCLVLDPSGSMKGAKLTALKDATKRVIELLAPTDIVSIVLFDETVEVLAPATPAADRAALTALVDRIEESGGTAMSGGLAAGQAELRKNLSPDRVSTMLLLTDGQAWGDEDQCRAIAAELGREGIKLTALGLGSEWNEKLLDNLADATGGLSDYIANPEHIHLFFQRALRAAQGTVATDARLLLRMVRDANPR